jgi:hypothetical protein
MGYASTIIRSTAVLVGAAISLLPSVDATIADQPICDTVLKCAQTAVDAALRAETAVATLKKQLSELESRRVEGNTVACTEQWGSPGSTSLAQCNDGEELMAGGCSMTCLDMMHVQAIPVGDANNIPHAWSCRQAPQDVKWIADDAKSGPRTFVAIAFCRKKLR